LGLKPESALPGWQLEAYWRGWQIVEQWFKTKLTREIVGDRIYLLAEDLYLLNDQWRPPGLISGTFILRAPEVVSRMVELSQDFQINKENIRRFI